MNSNLQSRPAKEDAQAMGSHASSCLVGAVEAALRLPGCPLCRAIHSAERESIWSFLHEGMMSLEVRNKFLASWGFCSRHFWMAEHIEKQFWPAGGFGLATLCEQLLVRTGRMLEDIKKHSISKPKSGIFRRGAKQVPCALMQCLFCAQNENSRALYVDALEEVLAEKQTSQLSFSANPFCLQHAREALSRWHNQELKTWLQRSLSQYVAELKADAQEFINKHDYRRRSEAAGREGNIVERARQFFLGWYAS